MARNVLNPYEVEELLALVDKANEDEREAYERWLRTAQLSDEERLAITFLTKIGGWEFVKPEKRGEEGGTVFFGNKPSPGGRVKTPDVMPLSALLTPSRLLDIMEEAPIRGQGLRVRFEHMLHQMNMRLLRAHAEIFGLHDEGVHGWRTAEALMKAAIDFASIRKREVALFFDGEVNGN